MTQPDLSLHWVHMTEDTFSDVAAQKIILSNTDRAPDKHFIFNKKFQEKK